MKDPTLNDLRVLTAAEASELLTVSVPVLERWRRDRTGPAVSETERASCWLSTG